VRAIAERTIVLGDDERFAALKEAMQIGLDDVGAGRCTTLATPEALAAFHDELLVEPLDT
jgi:hypothetical protein